MKTVLAGLVLNKAQYHELVSSCVARDEFPSWVEWNKQQIRLAADPKRSGGYPPSWSIEVSEFHDWCRRAGTVLCLDALCAYCHHLKGDVVAVPVPPGQDSTGLHAGS